MCAHPSGLELLGQRVPTRPHCSDDRNHRTSLPHAADRRNCDPPYSGRAMLNTQRNRAIVAPLVEPVARLLLAMRLRPSMVSFMGSAGVVIASAATFPRGQWLAGVVVVSVLALSDLLDGTMARLSNASGAWGAFLDSTLDRITDGALSAALVLGLVWTAQPGLTTDVAVIAGAVSLVLGQVVSYAKARAESIGVACDVGIAERAERVVLMLAAALAMALQVPTVAAVLLVVLAVLTLVTVVQRMMAVHRGLSRP